MKKILENKLINKIILAALQILMTLFVILSIFVVKHNDMTFIDKINNDNNNTIPIILTIALAVEGVFLLIGSISSIFKTKIAIIFLLIGLIYNITLSTIGLVLNELSIGHIVLFILNIIISLIGLIYCYIIKIKYSPNDNEIIDEDKKSSKKLAVINIINIVELIAALLIFFIPLAIFNYKDKNITYILIKGVFGSKELYEIIPCLVLLVIYIFTLNQYFNVFGLYKARSNNYIQASKKLSYFIFAIVILFFITGTIGANIITTTLHVKSVTTYSFIPFLVFIPIILLHGLVIGSVGYENQNKKLKNNKIKWMVFVFVTLFTLVTFISLFLSILSISTSNDTISSFFTPNYTITPWDLLTRTNKEKSFSVITFFILAIVLISAVLYFLSITSLFSKSKETKRIGLASIIANYIFIVALGLFGKYYEISYLITKDNIISYLNSKYPAFVSIEITNPTISSQIFFLIFVDTAIAIVLLILKPFTKSDDELVENVALDINDEVIKVQLENDSLNEINKEADDLKESNEIEEPEENESIIDDTLPNLTFDACPSFTELDLKINKFESDLNYRRTKLFENPSLPSLVTFIVDYARESRLHLSYTVETIAAFVAGLGSTKLSILQGMSGTGKTSLPKIFLEAIMGNCEIVEVESSWKDKNELLGYYNEFSKIYTPKKFTRALYKAALNPNVITFVVLDEMNLSRIEYYFSDFLSLMENEPENRKIQLTNIKIHRSYDKEEQSYIGLIDDHTLLVPKNVWFIGTANRDESTFEISDKVYDRAYTMNFNKRAPKVRSYSNEIDKKFLEYEIFEQMLNDAVSSSNFDLESVKYISEVEEILRPYNISFGNRIMNQIEKYVKIYSACFNNDLQAQQEAIEDILLSKVIAKLEFKAIEDKDELVRQFEKLKLYKCSEFIKRLSEDY